MLPYLSKFPWLKKKPETKLKVAVVGVRGIPSIEGGIETHCEDLYPRLSEMGFDITLFARKAYVGPTPFNYKGVHVVPLWAPKSQGVEALVHTFYAVIMARIRGADILHIHAIGPAIFVPLGRLLGMKVVMTHHGPDYDREKWGVFAKIVLKLGERLGVLFANRIVVISKTIGNLITRRYNVSNMSLIYNGVNPSISRSVEDVTKTIENYGLSYKKYVLSVGRFVPEKCFHDILTAFEGTGITVAIAGKYENVSTYAKRIQGMSIKHNAVLTGFVKGQKLADLFFGASLFVLASTHEGLPIALLEAMSYGIPVLVSDIPANLDVALPEECYFKVRDTNDLREKAMNLFSKNGEMDFTPLVKERYNWDIIAKQIGELYCQVVGNPKDSSVTHLPAKT